MRRKINNRLFQPLVPKQKPRLGTYRYLDMHMVIGESLDLAKRCLSSVPEEWPHFSAEPLPVPVAAPVPRPRPRSIAA